MINSFCQSQCSSLTTSFPPHEMTSHSVKSEFLSELTGWSGERWICFANIFAWAAELRKLQLHCCWHQRLILCDGSDARARVCVRACVCDIQMFGKIQLHKKKHSFICHTCRQRACNKPSSALSTHLTSLCFMSCPGSALDNDGENETFLYSSYGFNTESPSQPYKTKHNTCKYILILLQ